jgi:hypothetical protein
LNARFGAEDSTASTRCKRSASRTEAYEIVFGKHRPVRLGKLTYLQITPTNRAEIPEYSG